MAFRYADSLKKHNWVGGGGSAWVYHVAPTIVVKTVSPDLIPEEEEEAKNSFTREIAFYKRLNERQDRCQNIVDWFLVFLHHLFLSYCTNKPIVSRFYDRQEREKTKTGGFFGRLVKVKEYEDPALIARWIQQLTSALEYVEKMGFCHNDLHLSNCLLDENFNLKLTDFGRATTIGKLLEYVLNTQAQPILAGPLKGSYGLCCARTEQFAVGSLLFMVYGHEPYEDIELSPEELKRRVGNMEFPELNRHEVFDGLISACWHNVYPTMVFVAYDFKRKTKHLSENAEYIPIDTAKETKICKALVRKGILGPELALRFQPTWRRYLHALVERRMSIWQYILQRTFWPWTSG